MSANFVPNTRGSSQSSHVVWPGEQLIQASNKRDTDQKKQTRLCTEKANRSKTFDTVCVASFIHGGAEEKLVQRLYIISMFGYAFIGVKNSWGTGESDLGSLSVLLLARLAQVQRVRTSQGDREAQRL